MTETLSKVDTLLSDDTFVDLFEYDKGKEVELTLDALFVLAAVTHPESPYWAKESTVYNVDDGELMARDALEIVGPESDPRADTSFWDYAAID